ncbi:unnamed protein product [Mucor fragilis]
MEAADEHYENVDLHIRWSDRQDLILRVSPDETIYTIKEKIRQSSSRTENKYIRLIHNGRVLEDPKTLKEYSVGKIVRTDSKAKLEPPSPVYFHCSLSDYTPETPSSQNNQPQMTPPTGFDRLRESGFTEEDIRNIRTQFHRLHGTTFEEGPTEEARNLEEQWMDNTGETLPDGTIQGTYKEMMWGLMLGFFLGIICLFWFRESVFSRRHQMGIVAGILVNISFASVLAYGKLNLHNNKKPATRWAHHLSKWTVPKHYFSHFYVVGLMTAALCIVELVSLSKSNTSLFIMQLLDRYDSRIGTHHVSQEQCVLGLWLFTLHLTRRVYESFWVEKPSKTATMHVSHYLIGVGFYGAMVLGTWLEGASNVESSLSQQQDTYFNMTSLAAIALFLYASYHQYKCHAILSMLRQSKDQASSYSIPRGDWFEILVTPHYFADILVYLSLNILYRFQNYILICGLLWTIVNLSVVSGETQRWYQSHFSAEKLNQAFPHGRKRIIPGLY